MFDLLPNKIIISIGLETCTKKRGQALAGLDILRFNKVKIGCLD